MTVKLSLELRQALATQAGAPLQIEDPETHARYVLVKLDFFERLQSAMDYETNDANPREFYPVVDRVMQADDALDPTLDSYQHISADTKSS